MKLPKNKAFLFGCLTPICLLFTIIITIILVDKFLPTKANRALPKSASEIIENYRGETLPGDFVRLLKAKLPLKDFKDYAKNLELESIYIPQKLTEDERQAITTQIGSAPDWWDERNNFENCYYEYKPENDSLVRITWQKGYVYFMAVTW